MDAAHRAEEVKGEKTLYACNITDEISRLKDNAMTVIENGGNCIMLDVHGVGYSAVRMLAKTRTLPFQFLDIVFNGCIYMFSLPGHKFQSCYKAL